MIQFGNDKIEEIYYGSDKIKEVYHGSASKPSYMILTDGTRIGFESENTSVWSLSTFDSSLVINGVSYLRGTIKEIHFGGSYSGVTEMGNRFLSDCTSLTNVTLDFPLLNSVGGTFLGGCSSLTDLTLTAETPPIVGEYFLGDTPNLSSIYVPFASVQAYKTTVPWSSKSSLINGAYLGYELVWPESEPSYMILTDDRRIDFEIDNTPIAILSSYGFFMTINGVYIARDTIKEIHLGTSYRGVTEIGTPFLNNCASLTNVTLDLPILNSIGDMFLSTCPSLNNVTMVFPALNSVGNQFLAYCTSLTNITLNFPALNSVGNQLLAFCSSLTDLTLTAETPPDADSAYFLYDTPHLSSIYVSANSVNLYKTTVPWSSKSSLIKAI